MAEGDAREDRVRRGSPKRVEDSQGAPLQSRKARCVREEGLGEEVAQGGQGNRAQPPSDGGGDEAN